MNNKVVYLLFFSFTVLILLSFKSNESNQEPWKAPESADTIKSPYSFTPSFIREGEKLYNTLCVTCHGQNGLGDGQPGRYKIEPANFHKKQVTDQKDGALFWKLSNGRGIMPAYGVALSEEKRWQLIAYIRQFAKQNLDLSAKKVVVPLKSYGINRSVPSPYFPLPAKVTNAIATEELVLMVDTVAKGLNRAWSMTFLPDYSVLIAERSGKILRMKGGKLIDTLTGNIPSSLRDIKLHPEFKTNNLVYISYYIEPVKATGTGGYTALLRAKLQGNKLTEEKTIYKAGPFKNNGDWFGSKIGFDKGYVFFSVGIHSPRMNAQSLSAFDGKTMRLNYDGSIPKDNPFVNTPGALPEIYSYGHRMHQGMRRDPKTGRLMVVEFGELGGDELNILKPGANYGWPIATYSLEYSGAIISESPFKEGVEPPIHHYAIAPSDFDFVYGKNYPGWDGNIFIGGLATKKLYRLVMKDDKFVHDETMLHNLGRIREVVYGPDQFLYAMTEDTGILVRLIPLKKL